MLLSARVQSLAILFIESLSLTHFCLVDLIDVTLACKDANSIQYSVLVDVVTIADVDAEKRVDNSFVQIWKLKFND